MRPDDLHAAMRADLVCILKDVVGLIARIEASISATTTEIPLPVSFATAQNEGVVDQGEDQSAQKSGTAATAIPEAGAAQAGHTEADPRNSSRPAGEVASAPLSVDRTAPFAEIVRPKPKAVSKPLDPRPGRVAGVVVDMPGSVVSLDMTNLVVACPGGDWPVARPVALIMERMRNGEMFSDDVLAEVGSMGLDAFRESRRRWAGELAKRGVNFISTKHVGCRIEVAGT